MNDQNIQQARSGPFLWGALCLLFFFGLVSCGEKSGKQGQLLGLMIEQQDLYSELTSVLLEIEEGGLDSEKETMVTELSKRVRTVKEKLAAAPKPDFEEVEQFLNSEVSATYESQALDFAEVYARLQSSGKSSQAVDEAILSIRMTN